MSLQPHQLIRTPFSDELISAGITFACRSLHYFYCMERYLSAKWLKSVILNIATELGFRRWLERERIPYQLTQTSPIGHPGRYQIVIGGHALQMLSYLISSQQMISLYSQDPSPLLKSDLFIPQQLLSTPTLSESEVFVFAFVLGQETRSNTALYRRLHRGDPAFLFATPNQAIWTRPTKWSSLGRLDIYCDEEYPMDLEIGGQTSDHGLHIESVSPNLNQPAQLSVDLYSLLYVHPQNLPVCNITVSSPAQHRQWKISPSSWANLWIYGFEILFMGWQLKHQLLRQARRSKSGMRTGWNEVIPAASVCFPIAKLNPMHKLIAEIRPPRNGNASLPATNPIDSKS